MAVSIAAHYQLTLHLLSLLSKAEEKGNGRGCVVIDSSCSSMHNSTNSEQTAYTASKAGAGHLIQLMAVKLAPFGIRINSINPASERCVDIIDCRLLTQHSISFVSPEEGTLGFN